MVSLIPSEVCRAPTEVWQPSKIKGNEEEARPSRLRQVDASDFAETASPDSDELS